MLNQTKKDLCWSKERRKRFNTDYRCSRHASRTLQQKLQRVLNHLLKLLNPLSTNGTIHHLVVEATSNDDLVIPLGNGTLLSLNGDGNLADSTDSQDTGLRGVDNSGEALNGSVHTHVADGEGTTLVLLGLELVVTGTLAKVTDLVGDAGQTETLDVLDNGGDQTGGGGDSDTDVGGVVLTDDSLAVDLNPAGVDLGHLEQSGGTGLDQEVVDGELVLALSGGVQSLAELQELADGEGGGDEVVGVLSHGLLETVGDNLAHGGGGNILVAGGSRAGSTATLILLNILLGDLTTTAGTLQSLDGDTLLQSESLGSGADRGLTVQAGLELVTRSLGLNGGRLRGRGRGSGLSALGLLLLLGSRGTLVTTGISQGELLEGGDISTLLNKNGNGL